MMRSRFLYFIISLGVWGMSLQARPYDKLGGYRNVEVIAVDMAGVHILHDEGVAVLDDHNLQASECAELLKRLQKYRKDIQEKKVQHVLKLANRETDPEKSLAIIATAQDCTDAPSFATLKLKVSQLQSGQSKSQASSPNSSSADQQSATISSDQQRQLRKLNNEMKYLAGQLRTKKNALPRALEREKNSFEICQRKMRTGNHKEKCTCCPAATYTWELYYATKAACCKACIAAVIQRHDLENEIRDLIVKYTDVCGKIREIQPNADLPQIDIDPDSLDPSTRDASDISTPPSDVNTYQIDYWGKHTGGKISEGRSYFGSVELPSSGKYFVFVQGKGYSKPSFAISISQNGKRWNKKIRYGEKEKWEKIGPYDLLQGPFEFSMKQKSVGIGTIILTTDPKFVPTDNLRGVTRLELK